MDRPCGTWACPIPKPSVLSRMANRSPAFEEEGRRQRGRACPEDGRECWGGRIQSEKQTLAVGSDGPRFTSRLSLPSHVNPASSPNSLPASKLRAESVCIPAGLRCWGRPAPHPEGALLWSLRTAKAPQGVPGSEDRGQGTLQGGMGTRGGLRHWVMGSQQLLWNRTFPHGSEPAARAQQLGKYLLLT